MMKKKWILIILAAIAVLCAAFLFLNFRAAASNTLSDRNLVTTSMGDELPYAMQRRDKISIALAGEGPLVRALQKTIEAEMLGAGFGDIELVQGLEPAYPNPVLVIHVEKPGLIWTPFFATSQFAVEAGYSSAGDTTFMGKTPITIDNKNGPVLTMHAEYKISDRSWGLMSRLGYHQILADYLVQNILTALKDLYEG